MRKKKMTIWVMIKKITAQTMISFKDFLNLLLLVEVQQSMFSSYCNIFYVIKSKQPMMRKRKRKKSRPSKLRMLFKQAAANRAMTQILSKLPSRMAPWWM